MRHVHQHRRHRGYQRRPLQRQHLDAVEFGLHYFQAQIGLPQAFKLYWASNQLYVVGGFDRADNTGADNIARWDGTNWWSVGGDTSKGMG